jgi:hypothetical protein
MIQINDKVRIVRFDTLNLELQEYRKKVCPKTKNERYDWCRVGFYGDLKSAIGGMLKYCLMQLSTEEISDLSRLIERIDEIDKELKEYIKNERNEN